MKKSLVVLFHIGFWSCYVLMLVIMLGLLFKNNSYDEARIALIFKNLLAFAVIPSLFAFYLYYAFILPCYLGSRKVMRTVVYGVVISLFVAIVGTMLLSSISNNMFYDWRRDYQDGLLGIFIIATIMGVIGLLIKGFIVWFEDIKLKDELNKKNHDIELALVKLQLEPHFLFNTINNIDGLIVKNPDLASNYLNKLSDIMRFMLFEAKAEEISLSDEIRYVEKYMALQKIRTANPDYVHYDLMGSIDNKKIAPMVCIPFVENAFKHATNKKLGNVIVITIVIDEKFMKFECTNKYDKHRKPLHDSNGIGDELIKKRLNLIYPNRHTLKVTDDGKEYGVHLTIDYE